MGAAIKRTLDAAVVALLDANTIDWSWFVRIDVASPVGTKRYTDRSADFTGNVDGTSQAWASGSALQVGEVDQGRQFVLNPSNFSVANIDYVFSTWAASPGLGNAVVLIYVGWFNAAGALAGAVKLYHGKVDNHRHLQRSEFALTPWQPTWAKKVLTAVNGLSPLLPAALMPKDGETIYWNTTAKK